MHLHALAGLLDRHHHDPTRLVQLLREVQEAAGWISPQVITEVAGRLGLPRARVEGVAGFYSFFATSKQGDYRILFSDNVTDVMLGSVALRERLCRALGVRLGEVTPDGLASVGLTSCTGLCDQGPAEELKRSNLRGRGGAGFNTALKWETAQQAPGPTRFVICNADEGEPGTFKDRVLLRSHLDLVLDGMTVCAFVAGAQKGFIYLRGEYLFLKDPIEAALAGRRAGHLLGRDVGGRRGFDFDVELHLGAGAYLCGEESALIESLEGKRGVPRNRPPYPVTHGYLQQPTVVDNVETLAAAAVIAKNGAEWYRSRGTAKSAGSKVLSVSGDCARPGIYEPHGSCKVCTVKTGAARFPAGSTAGSTAGFTASCTLPAREGLAVESEIPELRALRRELVQLLFVEGNHFCPSCEKSGGCTLQAVGYFLEVTHPHFTQLFPDRPVDASHPDLLLDFNRCILCELCVRASSEIDNKHVFALSGRGIGKQLIVNAESGRLSDTSMALTDTAANVCPVGVILKKRRGFAVPIGQRPFDKAPINQTAVAAQPERAGPP